MALMKKIEQGNEAIREQLEADIHTLQAELDNVRRAIASVNDEQERLLLTLRYINGLQWKYVSEVMQLGRTEVWRIHQKALADVSFCLKGG